MDGKKFGVKVLMFAVACCSLLILAHAQNALWSAPTTVTISTFSPYIRVYEYYSGKEVTSINFGTLVPGQKVSIYLKIKNTHPNATFYNIYWGSTLSTITDKISDLWGGSWPITLGPGEYALKNYYVTVASDCPIGTYNWTLYLYPG